jgi:hypothetical protein
LKLPVTLRYATNSSTGGVLMSRANKVIKPLWRNWLARSAVNRKACGSSQPRGEFTEISVCFVHFLQLYSFLGYFTLLEV